MPTLTHKKPDGSDRKLEIAAAKPLVIGRVDESDIAVRDSFVSRVHCGIGFVDSHFTLKDLGSTNGTYRNGARVFQCDLANGDKIQVGNTTLVFEVTNASEDAQLRQVPQMIAPPSAPLNVTGPRPNLKQMTMPVNLPPPAPAAHRPPGLRPG